MSSIIVLTDSEVCAVFGVKISTWQRWQREGAPAGNEATVSAIRMWLEGKPGSYSIAPSVADFAPLPATAQAVADVIGREAALLLCTKIAIRALSKRNRIRFYVPLSKLRGRWIANIIGNQLYDKLHKSFAGHELWMPQAINLRRCERKAAIQRAYVSGIPISRIALIYNVTERLVYHYVSSLREAFRKGEDSHMCDSPPGIGSSDGGGVRVGKQAQGFSSHRGKKSGVTSPDLARASKNEGEQAESNLLKQKSTKLPSKR